MANMSEPTTSDIIAALHGDRDALAKVRGTRYGSWARTDEGIAAADRLAELDRTPCPYIEWSDEATAFCSLNCDHDALCPPCPTCGGTCTAPVPEVKPCPDCADGKVSVEQLVATYNAVHNSATWVHHSRDEAEIILRGVKP